MKQDNVRQVGAPLSKPEAVWKAIEELGHNADVTEILEYVRTKYGITAETDSPEVAAPAPAAVQSRPAPSAPPVDLVLTEQEAAAEPARKPAGQKKPRSRNDPSD